MVDERTGYREIYASDMGPRGRGLSPQAERRIQKTREIRAKLIICPVPLPLDLEDARNQLEAVKARLASDPFLRRRNWAKCAAFNRAKAELEERVKLLESKVVVPEIKVGFFGRLWNWVTGLWRNNG